MKRVHKSGRNQSRLFRAIESLESRRLLAGVTLIAHGYNSSGAADSWVDKMGDAIADRLGGHDAVAQFTMTVTGNWLVGPTGYTFTRDSGTPVWGSSANPSGEALIKLDWSDLDGGIDAISSVSTTQIADFVANVLLGNTVDGRPISEVSLHLIGHSRGASLMGQLAGRFGQQGIWVEQFTMLDPHPVDGIREPALPSPLPPYFYYPDFGDAPMTLWDNIVYADNYWRDANANLLDFAGESVNGANNYGPLSLLGGALLDHSDVHAYYAGTIDRDALNDGAGGPIVDAWYGSNGIRATAGYNRSRIGCGTRPGAGVSSLDGGSATRTHVALTLQRTLGLLIAT